MKNRLITSRFARLLHLPTALLMTFLQRTPVVKILAAAEEFVFSTPVAHVLKATIASVAALGAVDTMAGATTLIASPASPLSATVGTSVTAAFDVSGTQAPAGSWRVGGTLPPGLVISNTSSGTTGITSGLINTDLIFLKGTPTTAGTYVINLTAYESPAGGGTASPLFSYTVNVTGSSSTAPSITTQPASQSVSVGSTVTFSIVASGTGTLSYQWSKGTATIAGATSSTLMLSNVQAADAASYTVVVTNANGSVTSNAATLTITGLGAAPTISVQPYSTGAVIGGSATLSLQATNATSYQWYKDGVAIAGATLTSYTISNAQAANAGTYTCVVASSGGQVTSVPATVTVNTSAEAAAVRLFNISTRSFVGTSDSVQIAGFIIGGTQPKKVLIRASGPALAQFGVSNVLADPTITLYSGSTVIGQNDDWGSDANVPAYTAVSGATPFPQGSKDSAIAATLNPGAYTAIVSGKNNATGVALIEVFEADGSTSGSKLVNISTRSPVLTGDQVQIVGFIISGTAAKKLLIRANGPALTQYGVSGVLADPTLTLYSGSNIIGINDNWGTDPNVPAFTAAAGPAPFAAGSKDSALAVTLSPGAYTAIVSGVNSTTGVALIEVYEVP